MVDVSKKLTCRKYFILQRSKPILKNCFGLQSFEGLLTVTFGAENFPPFLLLIRVIPMIVESLEG